MSDIAIVTSTLASIPEELISKYEIGVAPQVVIWGEKSYLDGVDITPDEFYARLATAEEMPTSSQATLASFKSIYEPLVQAGRSILTIVASNKLTATINSAEQAKALFPKAKIEIVDSLGVSMSLGFQVLAAARAIEAGKSFEEVVEIARRAKNHTGVIFVVDTLEFLHRGGRLGGAQRLVGTALSIKPLLHLDDGRVEILEKVRTKSKAYARLLEVIGERIAGKSNVRLSVLHAAAEEDARKVIAQAEALHNPIETIYTEVSPVIGVHAGPGTVGLAYCTEL